MQWSGKLGLAGQGAETKRGLTVQVFLGRMPMGKRNREEAREAERVRL